MFKKVFAWTAGFVVAAFLPLAANAELIVTPLTVGNSYPSAGTATTISGSCGSTGINGSVGFTLNQNGTMTALPTSSNLTTDATGMFNGSVTFPSGYPTGPATLTVTCNGSGNTFPPYALTFPAPASTSFSLGSNNPNVGGVYNLNAACGGSNGAGTANLSLVSNGVTTSLGSVNLTPTGTFNNTVLIPTGVASGTATLLATCSNGTTFTSPLTVNTPAVNAFASNSNPLLGSANAISGTCVGNGGSVLTTSGPVAFSLYNNGTTTPLVGNNTTIDSSGRFNAVVSYPSGAPTGSTTLVVTCPGGGSYTTPITLSAAASQITPAGGLTMPLDPTAMGGVNDATTTSTGATIVPVGGVRAGGGASPASALTEALLLALLGLGGLFVSKRLVW